MGFLDDATLEHLRAVTNAPDMSRTKYTIVRELARGGMGTVYEAQDGELGRAVALKVVTAPEAMPDAIERLRREARTLARLEHPGIVPVHDIGDLPDGRLYYAMKLVRGPRLDEVAKGNAARAELLRIFGRVCEAVAFAHAHDVVHRDLKPENIMVGSFGEVLVLDWGLAGGAGVGNGEWSAVSGEISPQPHPAPHPRHPTVTAPGSILGTPGYMSPEQSRGDASAVDHRTDVYSLGAVLRWMVGATGESVPKAMAAIVARAMASVPGDRYQRVELLAADVEAFVERRPVSAYPEGALERLRRVATKYRTPIILVLAYLVMRVILLLAMRGRS